MCNKGCFVINNVHHRIPRKAFGLRMRFGRADALNISALAVPLVRKVRPLLRRTDFGSIDGRLIFFPDDIVAFLVFWSDRQSEKKGPPEGSPVLSLIICG